jgi:hypothetical protein
MKNGESPDDFTRRIVGQLAHDEEETPPGIAARLRESRLKALEPVERPSRARTLGWLTLSGVATAVVLVVAISLWNRPPKPYEIAMNPDDLEVLTAPEQIELYRDLDFYRWLAGGENGR